MNMLESISSCNFVEIDGYAYFSNLFFNALFKVEIKTGKTTFLGSFEDEKISKTNIHLEMILKEDQIYFFPRLGRHMHIYHLSNATIQSVEIRKKSEPFFWIEEVVLNDDFVYFLPKQNNAPIKKMEWNTYKVTDVNNKLIIQGKYLSKYRNIIPTTIVEKHQIRYGNLVSCKQMSDKKWYCFKPIGRQMLCFMEETYQLETVTLTVVNKAELQNHLRKVKQNLFKIRIDFSEFEGFRLREFLEVIILADETGENRYKEINKYNIGKVVWKTMEEYP